MKFRMFLKNLQTAKLKIKQKKNSKREVENDLIELFANDI